MPEVGIFLIPQADAEATVAQGVAAEEVGLDYVAVQDHPYQPAFFDTWTLLSYLAGPARTPKESVDALQEAIDIIRGLWSGDGPVSVAGEHYRVSGAKPGPVPAHHIGIWVGAYGPRMLGLTGRVGDGLAPECGRQLSQSRRCSADADPHR